VNFIPSGYERPELYERTASGLFIPKAIVHKEEEPGPQMPAMSRQQKRRLIRMAQKAFRNQPRRRLQRGVHGPIS
jgi:hypothetical protein